MDLELVSLEDLAKEFVRRFDGAALMGYRATPAGGRQYFYVAQGDALVLLGSLAVLHARLLGTAEQEMIKPVSGEM